MSNGKRWTIKGDPEKPCLEAEGPALLAHTEVEVMEVSEHNATLESLAQELEERERFATSHLRARIFQEVAQLVRAKIEEGDRG